MICNMVDLTKRIDVWLEDIKIAGGSASIIWQKLIYDEEDGKAFLKDRNGKIYFETKTKGLIQNEVINRVLNESPYMLRNVAIRLIVEEGHGAFGFKDMDMIVSIEDSVMVTVESTNVTVVYEHTLINYAMLHDAYGVLINADLKDEYAARLICSTKKFPYDEREMESMIRNIPSIKQLCDSDVSVLKCEEQANAIYYEEYMSMLRSSEYNI